MATKKSVKPAWATKGKEWMEDNDDAHFDGNPAYRKALTKKHVVGHTKASGEIKLKPTVKQPARKRVAGK
jgi:hypothetical protein